MPSGPDQEESHAPSLGQSVPVPNLRANPLRPARTRVAAVKARTRTKIRTETEKRLKIRRKKRIKTRIRIKRKTRRRRKKRSQKW